MVEVVQQYEQRIQTVLTTRTLLKTQRATLSAFTQYQEAEDISQSARLEYLYTLKQLGLAVRKSFKTMTRDDLTQYIGTLRKNDLTASTIDRYIQRIRRFFRWLHDPDDLEYPTMVKGSIFQKKVNSKGNANDQWLEPQDLLSGAEINALIESEDHPMWKCLWALLVSSGGRVNREVLQLKIQDIAIAKEGDAQEVFYVQLVERRVLCVDGLHFIKFWLSVHPQRFEKDAWLFFSDRDPTKPLPYPTVKSHLDATVTRASARVPSLKTKHVYCHLFRHTAATLFASKPSVSVFVMNQRFGWSQGSRMAQKYVHLASTDVEDVTRLALGLEPKKSTPEMEAVLDYVVVPRDQWEKLIPQVDLGLLKQEMEAELQRFKRELREEMEQEFTKFKTEQEDA